MKVKITDTIGQEIEYDGVYAIEQDGEAITVKWMNWFDSENSSTWHEAKKIEVEI